MNEQPIKSVIKKVKASEPKAVEALWLFLNDGRRYASLLQKGLKQEAEDIFITAFEAFCKIIRDGKFDPAGSTEQWMQNQTKHYFERILKTTIKHFKKPNFIAIEDNHAIIDDPVIVIKELSLLNKTIEFINDTGEVCRSILTHAIVYGKSNKMIAGLALQPVLSKTEAVTQKKKECLNRLYAQFIHYLSALPDTLQKEYIKVAMSVQEQLPEPCHSILKLHFFGKSNIEIAEELKLTIPTEIAKDLQTAQQVKKKKSRCLNSLREKIFRNIFNNRKTSNDE